jgi:hypothetical protein
MQKTMAEAGIPISQEYQMTLEGTGQAAAMLAQVGNMVMTTTVTPDRTRRSGSQVRPRLV